MRLWPIFIIFIIIFIKKDFTTFNPHILIGEILSIVYISLIVVITKNSIYKVFRFFCGNLFLQCCAIVNCDRSVWSTNQSTCTLTIFI